MSRRRAIYLLIWLHLLVLPVGSALAQESIWYEWIYQGTSIQRYETGQTFCTSDIPTAGAAGGNRVFMQQKGFWGSVPSPNSVCSNPTLLPDGSPNYRKRCDSRFCEFATFTYIKNTTPKPVSKSPITGLPRLAAAIKEYDSYPQLEYARSGESLMLAVGGLLSGGVWKPLIITLIAMPLVRLGFRQLVLIATRETDNRLPDGPKVQALSVKMNPKTYDGQD